MNFEAPVGSTPHTRHEASPSKSSDARCACGATRDDAHRTQPACRSNASARARPTRTHRLYSCDTPGCPNWKAVVTPAGYYCRPCVATLERVAADPRLATDGGRDTRAARAFELIITYTTMDGRRQRVTYLPATNANAADGDDARRITNERHDGGWRETSRQPISNLAVHLDNQPGRTGGTYAGP
ncbi:hypothetical protein [Natronolimnobius sp. AArcel1]|uniref:hypothetical protein n=1 Tax=Natronolimnobius sp. AArcel1 TaxID=1679093 RepID=UPI0019D04EF3|nr:hypothetical protein [Natronolimnobius sp. AArcel1]